ncbi:hypothetical protein CDAR_96671 [Caerostris darwini]|uniref:Uncharacterized protein n=1 Tax=Caerostris darwini TaxID=1538125 RepID=A0AAV4QYB4_9ARAC|nr:hypothetical protein CDAR_96671 [Caerostris darwini]
MQTRHLFSQQVTTAHQPNDPLQPLWPMSPVGTQALTGMNKDLHLCESKETSFIINSSISEFSRVITPRVSFIFQKGSFAFSRCAEWALARKVRRKGVFQNVCQPDKWTLLGPPPYQNRYDFLAENESIDKMLINFMHRMQSTKPDKDENRSLNAPQQEDGGVFDLTTLFHSIPRNRGGDEPERMILMTIPKEELPRTT